MKVMSVCLYVNNPLVLELRVEVFNIWGLTLFSYSFCLVESESTGSNQMRDNRKFVFIISSSYAIMVCQTLKHCIGCIITSLIRNMAHMVTTRSNSIYLSRILKVVRINVCSFNKGEQKNNKYHSYIPD